MAERSPARPRPWALVSSKINTETNIFTLRTDLAESPRTGKVHPFHILESPDWVNIVAFTPEQRILLIRQFRFGTGEVTLEIPGGLIEPDDTPHSAALRELREETGYVPGTREGRPLIRQIGRIRPNPAFMNNTCYTFLVEEAVEEGSQNQDPAEDISVELHPMGDIPHLIKSGQIDHGIALNALQWWQMSLD